MYIKITTLYTLNLTYSLFYLNKVGEKTKHIHKTGKKKKKYPNDNHQFSVFTFCSVYKFLIFHNE